MSRTGSMLRMRWPFLAAVAVIVAVAIAGGSTFAVNSGEQPVQEAAAAQVQPDLTDPGLNAAVAEPRDPVPALAPRASLAEPSQPDPDPGAGQVVPQSSGSLSRWLADRPGEMGPFSIQDAMAADSLDVEWMLYQAVAKDVMTDSEADDFRAWFEQRPTIEEAPELINHLPEHLPEPGIGGSGTGKSGKLGSR